MHVIINKQQLFVVFLCYNKNIIGGLMNKYKDILKFFIFCFITCFIVKYVLSKYVFSYSLLTDSLIISLAATLGWSLGSLLNIKKKKK